MPGKKKTSLLDKAYQEIKKKSPELSNDEAWAIAVKTLQKSGSLKKGSLKETNKGKKRNEMSKKQRAKTRSH